MREGKQLTDRAFATLQKLGKALMLPVAVLPGAGLLLGIGSAEFALLPHSLSEIMAAAGGAVFSNLPILFAIGVALGFSNNDGVSALAAAIGYVVMLAVMGVVAGNLGYQLTPILGIHSVDTGVFGGILAGAMASWCFNRYYRIQLPPYLGFFAGKRLVPIATAFGAILLGTLLSLLWPPIGKAIAAFSHWAATESPNLAFSLYGFVERLLIPFGLHHIWNVPFFFEVGQYLNPASGEVIRGEIHRYIAGDPSAGNMSGGYLFKMWGLPAAGLAIWHCARPQHRARIGGIMLSAALTSFLTGITEPLEFAFLFLAPLLYLLHAVLAGAAYFLCIELGIKHGMTFSHGLIDYLVLLPKSTHGLWLVLIGPLWGMLYYTIFRLAIVRFNLATPGREDDAGGPARSATPADSDLSQALVAALGGRSNLVSLDACITRLRAELKEITAADPRQLKALGAADVVVVGNSLQAIFGTRSEQLKTDIEAYLGSSGESPAAGGRPVPATATAPSSATSAAPVAAGSPVRLDTGQLAAIVTALGGRDNIHRLTASALTRLRVELGNPAMVDHQALADSAGIEGVMPLPGNILHLLVGLQAKQYETAMLGLLAR